MGVDPAFRVYLMTVLKQRPGARECFFAVLPEYARERPFDVVIIDLMQDLAVLKGAGPLQTTGADVQRRISDAIGMHLEADGRADAACVAQHLVVGCLDNAYQVPRNKAFVESQRDEDASSSVIITTGAEYDAIVAQAADLAAAAAREAHRYSHSMSATDSAEAHARSSFSDERDFLVTEGPIPASGARIWRNVSLSWQLKRLVTTSVCRMEVPEGKHVLLDEGLPLNRHQYGPLRARMLQDHGAAGMSAHERAALVGHLMKGCLRRVVIGHGGHGRQLPVTGLGESDHKILYYVQRRAPLGLNVQRPRYLIKCQDTDVMWQMLAHMRTLINPATGEIDEVDVWFDTQTPADRAKGVSREYRFIDAVELWRQTHAWLAESFGSLKNPLETLLFCVFCNNNDYVERFPAHMKIGPATVWNTFMELLALGSGKPTYPNSAGKATQARQTDRALWRLGTRMNTLMICAEKPTDFATARFECPVPLVEGGDLALHVYDTPLVIDPKIGTDFLYALVQRSASLRAMALKHGAKDWPITAGAYMEDQRELLETIVQLHAREMAIALEHNDRSVAPMFDVPIGPLMEARLARIAWTLNYYVNGWKTPVYTYNWFEHDGEYSLHGWRASDVTATPRGHPNSQYLYADYHPPSETAEGHYRYLMPEMAHEVVLKSPV